MSWAILNEILALATVDQVFQRKLLENPLEAIHKKGFHLTEKEKQVLQSVQAPNLQAFTHMLLEQLPYVNNA